MMNTVDVDTIEVMIWIGKGDKKDEAARAVERGVD
jgi:hypothetical protein